MIRSKIHGVYVYGYYAKVGKKHCLIPENDAKFHCYADGFCIDGVCVIFPSQTAVATGKKDKNGDEIFGSKGEFTDGDWVAHEKIIKPGVEFQWNESCMAWSVGKDWPKADWYDEMEDGLEIIPKEQTPQQETSRQGG